ncbi:nuclease-related domain-containing protein [Kaarinaea lacus]
MNAELPSFLSGYDSTLVVGISIVIAASLGLLLWFLFKFRHPADNKIIERSIREISSSYIHNMVLSDGLYGYHFIDYIVRLPGQILVLTVQDADGYIFGGEKIEKWTQVVHNRSTSFDNPLMATSHYIQALRGVSDNVEIIGRVVFSSRCTFPKGVPEGVIEMHRILAELEKLRSQSVADVAVEAAWAKFLETGKQHKIQYKQDLSSAA